MSTAEPKFLSNSTGNLSYSVGMAEQVSAISRAISDVLTGAYRKKRLGQEDVAERAGMSIWTLQKKLKGRAPISATDLVVLSKAIGVEAPAVLDEAMRDVAHVERLASEGIANISDKLRRKKPSEMTEEELHAFEGESAANTDPEIGHDEPESP